MTRRATGARSRTRRSALLAALVAIGSLGLAGLAAPAAQAATTPDFTTTATLARTHLAADGGEQQVDSRTVTVAVDQTRNLQGRQRIAVRWTGAHPSGARASSPYGISGFNQEYPVMILQCRGKDDPTLPAAQQLAPQTCWTSTQNERFRAVSSPLAVWEHDRYQPADDRTDDGADPASWPAGCTNLHGVLEQHLLPFVAANGTSYASCSSNTLPPEGAIDAALPPAEMLGFTELDGSGEAQFEVRTEQENESLGCSAATPCSLVVIPIMGISCADQSESCRSTGGWAPGSSNPLDLTVDDAVSAYYWWSASNWRNRIVVPLTFALAPNVCDILDDRAPVDVYGSELLSQASLQWAPAYCLRADRFKLRHDRFSEPGALRLLGTGDAAAAFVSQPATASVAGLSGKPVAYAPTAVSGFAIAFDVDLPDNAGVPDRVRLTARLLAKLLTQSYPTVPDVATNHPGLAGNPVNMSVDPEFTELNPGLGSSTDVAAAVLLALSDPSDVTYALTSYLAADGDAMAFIGGKPDPWGMRVNPSYQGISLPVSSWPLRDTWVRPLTTACWKDMSTPWMNLMAAPVSSLSKTADALLDSWPNVQTVCSYDTSIPPKPSFGRVKSRQTYGARFMFGVVSLGDAARYGLSTVQLRTSGSGPGGTYVAASEESMSAALAAARQGGPGQAFLIDYAALPDDAYPGTMIVHTAALLQGLPQQIAGDVTQLIQVATTEGQVQGANNGQLPAGYLPITATGATAPLYASAQLVAQAILRQDGTVGPEPAGSPGSSGAAAPLVTTTSAQAPGSSLPDSQVLAGSGTTAVPGLAAAEPGATPVAGSTSRTVAPTSRVADRALPVSLGLALAGALGAPALRLWTTRRRPS